MKPSAAYQNMPLHGRSSVDVECLKWGYASETFPDTKRSRFVITVDVTLNTNPRRPRTAFPVHPGNPFLDLLFVGPVEDPRALGTNEPAQGHHTYSSAVACDMLISSSGVCWIRRGTRGKRTQG